MKAEKLDVIGVDVRDLDAAIRLFSDILGITFVVVGEPKLEKTSTDYADRAFEEVRIKVAIDRTGFMELIESMPPIEKEGLRNIHFKVPNLEQAKAEMKQKGIHLIADIKVGKVKEAIFSPEDLHGIRLCLVEYEAPNLVDAILQE